MRMRFLIPYLGTCYIFVFPDNHRPVLDSLTFNSLIFSLFGVDVSVVVTRAHEFLILHFRLLIHARVSMYRLSPT